MLWDVHAGFTHIITLCSELNKKGFSFVVAMLCTVGTLNIQTDLNVSLSLRRPFGAADKKMNFKAAEWNIEMPRKEFQVALSPVKREES